MDWKKELQHNIKTAEDVEKSLNWNLSSVDKNKLEEIIKTYPMSVPEYYLSLINPNDPDDPIRKLCIPSISETDMDGSFDTSGEADNTVVQ
ncbi:MAG: KamA family radical SAM protein, partial [Sedimentibacter sp.]